MADVSVLGIDIDTSGLGGASAAANTLASAMQNTATKANAVEAAFVNVTASTRNFGQAVTGSTDAAVQQLNRLTDAANKAASAIEEMNATGGGSPGRGFKDVGESAKTATGHISGGSTALREFLVLVHEGASGNYKRMFGSGLIELQAVAGVGAAGAVVAGLGVAAAGTAGSVAILKENMKGLVPDDVTKGLGYTHKQLETLKEDGEKLGVTFGDTFLATFQVLGKDISTALGNPGKKLSDGFASFAADIGKMTPGIIAAFASLAAEINSVLKSVFGNGILQNAAAMFANGDHPQIMAQYAAKLSESVSNYKPLDVQQTIKDAAAAGEAARVQALAYANGFLPRVAAQAVKNAQNRIYEAAPEPEKVAKDANLAAFGAQLQAYQEQSNTLAALRASGAGNADYETQTIDQLAKAYDATKKAFADYLQAKASGNQLDMRLAKEAADAADKELKGRQQEAEQLTRVDFQNQAKSAVESTTASQGDFAGQVLANQYKLAQETYDFKKQGANLDEAEIQRLLNREDIVKRSLDEANKAQAAQRTTLDKTLADAQTEIDTVRQGLATGDANSLAVAQQVIALKKQNNLLSATDLQTAAQKLVLDKQELDYLKQRETELQANSLGSAVRSADASLVGASNRFWDDFVINGGAAFQTLGVSLESIFRSTVADGLKAGFQPVLSYLQDQLKNLVKSVFSGVSDYFKGALQKAGILDSNGKFSATGLGGAIGTGLQYVGAGVVGYGIGSTVSAAAGGEKTVFQQQNSQIGGAAGTAIGAYLGGPVGAFIGSAIGSFIGGLLGPSSTNAGAGQGLDFAGGNIGGVQGNKRTQQTTDLLSQVVGAIKSGYDSITQLGGTRTVYVTGVTVGQRDPSAITFSNGTSTTSAVGDSTAAANAALIQVLKTTTFAVDGLNKIKDAMIAAGSSFDATDKVLTSVKSILDSVQPPISSFRQALTNLQNQFDPLIQSANAASAALLKQAEATAKAQIANAFNTDISNQLLKAQSSVAAQYHDMLQTQAQRIGDATALGADLNQVMALNQQETTNFVASLFPAAKQTSTITDNIEALTTAFAQLSAQAVKAGQSTTQITQAYQSALTSLQAQFNQSIADSLLQAANPTLASLETLLNTQKQRLSDAKALGVDLTATQRLNAIETSNFFAGLSATQKAQLGDYLGLIQDYTGKIGVVGTQLQDALTPIVSNMTSIINALNASASTLRNLALTISQTKDAIAQKYGSAAPTDALDALRSKFQDQAALAKGGDQTALQGLSQLANSFIDASHALYGSTAKFVSDYDLVQSLLGQAGQGATDAATQAENQAQALQTQINLLTDIKNILGDSQPQIAALQKDYLALTASATQVSATIAGILQQPNNGLTGVTTDVSTYQIGAQSISDLLGQYLALQAKQSGQTLNSDQLAQLSLLTAGSAANTTAVTGALANANATVPAATTPVTAPSTTQTVPTPPPVDTTASDSTLATVSGYFQLLQQQIRTDDATQLSVLQNLLTEFRKLTLYTQQSTAKA